MTPRRTAILTAGLLLVAGCGDNPDRVTTLPDENASYPDDVRNVPDAAPDAALANMGNVADAVDPGSAEAAAGVIRTYYALLQSGRFRQAWQLWADDGKASGLSPEGLADLYDGYSGLQAEVGDPGEIEAGAGQRYVTIPVRVRGRDPGDAEFTMTGRITLHRVADVPGATAPQRGWRIARSTVRARDAAADAALPDGVPDTATARYDCRRAPGFSVRFDNRADTATIALADGGTFTLTGQRPASGIWYRGEGYELRGKGGDATLTTPDGGDAICTAR